MLNPHYPTLRPGRDRDAPWLVDGAEVDEDSGAFQERDMLTRLTPGAALDRQLDHERRIREHVRGFRFRSLVTYDMLVGVDEAIEIGPDGQPRRVKQRGTVDTARAAVDETKRAADVYRRRRREIAGGISYSAQGAEPDQYLDCVEVLLGHVRPGIDCLALGGFCIVGLKPSLLPTFAETVRRAVPLAARAGCTRVHVLGVTWPPALEVLAAACAAAGIPCSSDSAAIETNSIMGKVWSLEALEVPPARAQAASPWIKTYKPGDKLKGGRGKARVLHPAEPPAGRYHPAALALANLERFDRWCRSLTWPLLRPDGTPWREQPIDPRGLDLLRGIDP